MAAFCGPTVTWWMFLRPTDAAMLQRGSRSCGTIFEHVRRSHFSAAIPQGTSVAHTAVRRCVRFGSCTRTNGAPRVTSWQRICWNKPTRTAADFRIDNDHFVTFGTCHVTGRAAKLRWEVHHDVAHRICVVLMRARGANRKRTLAAAL